MTKMISRMSSGLLLGAICSTFSHLTLAADAAANAAEPIVLKAAHLFDSVSGKLVDHGVVVVAGTKIQAVGTEARFRQMPG